MRHIFFKQYLIQSDDVTALNLSKYDSKCTIKINFLKKITLLL